MVVGAFCSISSIKVTKCQPPCSLRVYFKWFLLVTRNPMEPVSTVYLFFLSSILAFLHQILYFEIVKNSSVSHFKRWRKIAVHKIEALIRKLIRKWKKKLQWINRCFWKKCLSKWYIKSYVHWEWYHTWEKRSLQKIAVFSWLFIALI